MILDFTITTCLRPEILRRTLESFRANLRGVEWEKCAVYCNVDCIGANDRTDAMDIDWALAETFGRVIVNNCIEPSFARAVKWCFSQPTTEYAFHLEDDWELLEPVEIAEMVAMIDEPTTPPAVVNLRAKPHFSKTLTRCFLSPGLWRSDFMRMVAAEMSGEINPEIQLWNIADRYHAGRYWPDHVVIRDIGREWLKASGFRKNIEVDRGVNPWTKWEAK